MTKKYNMTINGLTANVDEYIPVISPSHTDQTAGYAPMGTESHLNAAVAAAKAAFATWRKSSDEERIAACNLIADAIEENADELATLLSAEQGKTLHPEAPGAHFEVGGCIGWARHTATLSLPDKVLEDSETNHIVSRREPLGVVGSITPWNFPIMIAIWHVVPAIRTGNTVVIKPSPFTPLSTLRMFELINEKLAPGLINVISGGDDLGAMLTNHPDVSKIVFTGSVQTGKKVMASAATNITPVTLELGGNDAGIILPGTDVSQITEGLFWGSMINSGQTCSALKRLYVHESDYEAACSAMSEFFSAIPMGVGDNPDNVLGPVQNKRQFDKVCAMVEQARKTGARILTGGKPQGGDNYIYPVTLIADVSEGHRIVDEEQFGPVLPIIKYTDLDDAIARANGTDFGLAASVWGTDKAKLADVASQLEAGTVYINKHAELSPHVPFGGIKCSGLGVEFAEEGLAAYTSIRVTYAAA